MNDNPASIKVPQGSMFLYQQPEYLNKEDHEHLGWRAPDKPFEFTRSVMSVPLVASEIASAQKHYPVVFSGKENPVPLAVVSVIKDRNMFVDEDGQWDRNCYIPSYLRRHPFAVARGDGDQFAIVIDRASKGISENPEAPFWEGEELSERTRQIVDFCGQFEAERNRTRDFTEKLAALGLLSEQKATHPTPEGERPIANFFAVNVEKLNTLPEEEIVAMHGNGYLSFIFAHLFSLENWGRLMVRSNSIIAESSNA